jgi:hypothetical protein
MEATAWGLPKSRRATRGRRRAGWGHPAEIASARARSDRAGRRRRADGGVGCVGQGGGTGQGVGGVQTVSSDASAAYSVRRRARALSVAWLRLMEKSKNRA